jgi:hypothetical protein
MQSSGPEQEAAKEQAKPVDMRKGNSREWLYYSLYLLCRYLLQLYYELHSDLPYFNLRYPQLFSAADCTVYAVCPACCIHARRESAA